jgi:hypothetical protein
MIVDKDVIINLKNRTQNEHFAYLKQAAKLDFAAIAFNNGCQSKGHFNI